MPKASFAVAQAELEKQGALLQGLLMRMLDSLHRPASFKNVDNGPDANSVKRNFEISISDYVKEVKYSPPPGLGKIYGESSSYFPASASFKGAIFWDFTTCVRLSANGIGLKNLLQSLKEEKSFLELEYLLKEAEDCLSVLQKSLDRYFQHLVDSSEFISYGLLQTTTANNKEGTLSFGDLNPYDSDEAVAMGDKTVVRLVFVESEDGWICGDGRTLPLNMPAPFDARSIRDTLGDLTVVSHPSVPYGPRLKSARDLVSTQQLFVSPSIFFTYEPLKHSNSTRVLIVEPETDGNKPIRFRLEEIELSGVSNVKDYVALSYTWDQQTSSVPAFCDDRILFITKNCADVLHVSRRICAHQKQKYTVLWIDAISIDQGSKTEKSHQVARMTDIYRLATRVMIYPGPCDTLTRDILKILGKPKSVSILEHGSDCSLVDIAYQELFNYFKRIKVGGPDNLNACSKTHNPSEVKKFVNDMFRVRTQNEEENKLSLPLKKFLDSAWFTRMWTIQEVSMSKPGEVILLATDGGFIETLDFDAFAHNVLSIGRSIEQSGGSSGISHHPPSLPRQIQRLGGWFDNSHLTLPQLLIDMRLKAATDPRDKIFALYGTIKAQYPTFPQPDYTKSVVDVYKETVIFCMNTDQLRADSLHFLYAAPRSSYGKRLRGLPSWVPDFSQISTYSGHLPYHSGRHFQLLDETNTPPYAASRASSPAFQVLSDQKTLRLSGTVIREILKVGWPIPPVEPGPSKECIAFLNIHILLQWGLVIDSLGLSWRGVLNHLQRTIEKWKNVNRTHRLKGFELKGGLFQAIQALRDTTLSVNPQLTEWLEENSMIGSLDRTDYLLPSEHTLILTSFGESGIAFGDIKAGDGIALISGMDMPLILRKKGHCWKLVGFAFVDGIMEGNWWPGNEQGLYDIDLV